MTLSIKNTRYAFLLRLDLMFSMSLWKEFQLLQILSDLSVRYLIKLTLYGNDVKLLKFKRSPLQVNLRYVSSFRFWLLLPEIEKPSRKTMEWLICFLILNLMLGCLLFKKIKKFNESLSLPEAARMSSTYLK